MSRLFRRRWQWPGSGSRGPPWPEGPLHWPAAALGPPATLRTERSRATRRASSQTESQTDGQAPPLQREQRGGAAEQVQLLRAIVSQVQGAKYLPG